MPGGAEEVFNCFDIVLDAGKNPVYHGGELITGNLKIELKQPMIIQAIRLQFKGRAAYNNCASSKGAEMEKVYFDKDFTLLDRPPGRPESGHFPWMSNFLYSLPFECLLPYGCPTSYENPQAYVRYFIRVTVLEEVLTQLKEYVAKKAITVVSLVEPPPAELPVAVSEVMAFGGCCCRGKLCAEVQLPKNVYRPGEWVVGSIKIDNRHPKHIVDQMESRLIDRVVCVGAKKKSPMFCRTLIVNHLDKTDVVKSKSTMHIDQLYLLQIPAVAPSFGASRASDTADMVAMSADETAPSNVDAKKIPESPSSATLKFRKQPFLRVDYAIQVVLGDRLLLEVPITIASPPISGDTINYQPFIAGSQSIPESDECEKFVYGSGFVYTPLYPVLATGAQASNGEINAEQR